MFSNLFSRKTDKNKTGFYKIDEGKLIEIEETPGNGSINSIIEYLGYPKNYIYIVHTFNSTKINCLGFKTLCKELIFVLAKSPETKLLFSDVSKEVGTVDWSFEYSSLNIEDILNEGIELENFDFDFLKSVIDLTPDGENLFKSKKLGLYFQFDDGILKAFTSSGMDNSSTKWLKDLNSIMVRKMTEEASLYHDNEIDTMDEVNKQAQSLLGIPHAVNNEYIPLHRNHNGNVNFYNLLMTHYTQTCNLNEFLFINKGRYSQLDRMTYGVGNFIYEFDYSNELKNVISK